MQYSREEVLQYVREEDVKFIRLAFCDVFGVQKNISILPDELDRAFEHGIAFDASAIAGFCDEAHSDLLLRPEPETLTLLPWRPERGKVVRMLSSVTHPDGTPFEGDTRALLRRVVEDAKAAGLSFSFGPELEFYLFKLDEDGSPTKIPYDTAGYMDIAPEDKGENIRREICLTLEQMGVRPERSHHEQGPGQNEIDFRYSDALTAADDAQTFRTVVRTVAGRNGLHADFSPKPLADAPGNGFHINVSVRAADGDDKLLPMIAGLLAHAEEMTLFLNPTENAYARFGTDKAPRYVSWSAGNRSQLVRVPSASGEYRRAELRSPDPTANPYLAFALMICAATDGIVKNLPIPEAADVNFFEADERVKARFRRLPDSLDAARRLAESSGFIRAHIPAAILNSYLGR